MLDILRGWYKNHFSDPQAVFLALFLIISFSIILTMGDMLMPVLAAIVIAYLLEGIVRKLELKGVKRIIGVILVSVLFITFLFFILFGMVPLLSSQVTQFVKDLPNYLNQGQALLLQLPQQYSFITEQQVRELTDGINKELALFGQQILTVSLSSIPSVITLAVYLVLVPMLVFFFLKDKKIILGWFTNFMPRDMRLASQVWTEMDLQLGRYVRGKFVEIIIVGIATYIGFIVFDLKYAILLAVLVGLSVLIPYIGAAVVTIPVTLIGYVQWGWSPDFIWMIVVYGIIQALDGNVLVPLLFEKVVNLHPVAIIVSILVFGGLWGFWGVFFAIPLATLVKALITSWPEVTGNEPA